MDQLQSYLVDILGVAVKNVYIKPPANMQMEYPCVLISRAKGETAFADNNPYRHQKRYLLTAIAMDPDSGLYDKLAALPRCVHDRSFPADNLNHDVFTIFFEEEE
jgi:hypothetical protein